MLGNLGADGGVDAVARATDPDVALDLGARVGTLGRRQAVRPARPRRCVERVAAVWRTLRKYRVWLILPAVMMLATLWIAMGAVGFVSAVRAISVLFPHERARG